MFRLHVVFYVQHAMLLTVLVAEGVGPYFRIISDSFCESEQCIRFKSLKHLCPYGRWEVMDGISM